jgi:Family of unknown function (DUF6084)
MWEAPMPDLDFGVVDAEVLPFAAGPTMLFKLHIQNAVAAEQIHSIMLRAQVRIEPTRRHYDPETEARLLELFGAPHQWGETLRSLLWTHATTIVPRFSGSTIAELPILCTYDFEVAAAKYFYALEDGVVPLLFLFSGTVFYTPAAVPLPDASLTRGASGSAHRAHGEGGLQIAQIPWEKEAPFRLPVRLWKEMMERYFPNSAWLRVRKDVFDRLYAYKARHALPTWEDTLARLLRDSAAEVER